MGKINLLEYEKLKEAKANGYEWMARDWIGDCGGDLSAHSEKPIKNHDTGDWVCDMKFRSIGNHLFQFIQWEDDEPYSIQELIEEYEFGKILLAMAEEETVLEFEYESEETEVKKALEQYKRRLERLKEVEMDMWNQSADSEDQAHFSGSIYALDKALEILEEIEDPKVEE